MAIAISDNFKLNKAKPDFERQEYATLSDMAFVRDARMPELYFAYCLETHQMYLYNKQNELDPVLGKWRPFDAGESIQVEVMPEASEDKLGKVYQYIGITNSLFTQGFFYVCKYVNESYLWQYLPTGKVINPITTSEIDDLFERL